LKKKNSVMMIGVSIGKEFDRFLKGKYQHKRG